MHELKNEAHRTGKPLKLIVNETLQRGLRQKREPTDVKPFKCRTFSMGHPPLADIDKALALAMRLEDEEIKRKIDLKK